MVSHHTSSSGSVSSGPVANMAFAKRRSFGARVSDLYHERGVSGVIGHIRTVFLHRLLESLPEKTFTIHESRDTSRMQDLEHLTVQQGDVSQATHYAPTPRRLFRWIHDCLPKDLKEWTFYDIGAGKGRIVLSAAHYPYKKVVGVEFTRELFEDALINISKFPRHHIRAFQVEMLEQDATQLVIPASPCIFYLFNPFQSKVLRKTLTNILKQARRHKSPCLFIYLNPVEDHVFEEAEDLKELKLPFSKAFKFSLFSPYGVRIYANERALHSFISR